METNVVAEPKVKSASARAAKLSLAMSLLIDQQASEPIQTQIYVQIRGRILEGQLRPGDVLPSTRRLATDLQCSRTPVLWAYEQLASEGFIDSRPKSGARVSANVAGLPIRKSTSERVDAVELSQRGTRMSDWVKSRFSPRMLDTPGHPDPGSFPFEIWSRLHQRIWREPSKEVLWCTEPAGYPPLREALAQHLRITRLLRCEPEQVVITTGIKQSVDLVGRLLLDVGDRAIIEDPSFPPWYMLDSLGISLVPSPVDEHGLCIRAAEKMAPDAKLAIVTPSHQFPLGGTMPLSRRLELLRWAQDRSAWILEDDFDSEFKYSGAPIAALQGLDGGHRVIYAGTFSKSLFSSLRMGYLVLPSGMVDQFVRARRAVDTCAPLLPQPVMAAFIAEGHLASHIRAMQQIYRSRHEALLAAVDDYASAIFQPLPTETGLSMALQTQADVAETLSDVRLAELAVEAGLHASALSGYCRARAPLHGLLIGLGTENERELEAGIKALSRRVGQELRAN